MQVLTISEEVQAYLTDIIDANPDLNAHGWRFSQRGEVGNDGASFDSNRQQMLSDDFAEQVTTAAGYIDAHRSSVLRVGSYDLKHRAERWGASVSLSSYVSNGAAICAALLQGFTVVRVVNFPNCQFSRSSKQ